MFWITRIKSIRTSVCRCLLIIIIFPGLVSTHACVKGRGPTERTEQRGCISLADQIQNSNWCPIQLIFTRRRALNNIPSTRYSKLKTPLPSARNFCCFSGVSCYLIQCSSNDPCSRRGSSVTNCSSSLVAVVVSKSDVDIWGHVDRIS